MRRHRYAGIPSSRASKSVPCVRNDAHTELREIIHNGENSGVEFKRDVIQNLELAKELVAFSNSEGGAVLWGIEGDGPISEIARSPTEMFVMNTCRDKIRSALISFYEGVTDVEGGKDVVAAPMSHG